MIAYYLLKQGNNMLKSIINFFKLDKQTIVLLIFILCFKSFAYNPSYVPSGSMLPTIDDNSLILVDVHSYGIKIPFTKKTIFNIGEPERGDIAVFRMPLKENVNYIKRIVAIPGDTIYFNESEISVNKIPKNMPNMQVATVPQGSYFAVGDNILHSYDSRFWGFVPKENLVGKYVTTIVSLKRFFPARPDGIEFNQEQKEKHKENFDSKTI